MSDFCKPTCFLFDLDGLILDTESLCIEIAGKVLQKYGKSLNAEAHKVALGKRPLDCWRDVAKVLELDVDPQILVEESEVLLTTRWHDARLLPGAIRLLTYCRQQGLPVAVATSTPRSTFKKKMANKPELEPLFNLVVCGDEVQNGKPAPDVFLEAAQRLGRPSHEALVLEDAPSGVQGAIAAGMRVVAVPSLLDKTDFPDPDLSCKIGVTEILPSLLAFDPTRYSLPPFCDLVGGLIPLEQQALIRIRGLVVKGFGRGSKELGIPTANVDSTTLNACLGMAVTGIYAGFVSIGKDPKVHPMVMSIGWNPFYGNKEKTAEPWVLADFEKPFYDEEIRLVACAYVRPEANFSSLQALIDRIHLDGKMSREALQHPTLAVYREEPILKITEAAT